MIEINKSVLKNVYKKRDHWSRKYNFGHLLVIGGSKQYSGSPALVALAALRSGVDLVTVVAPERAANIIASFSPDLIAYPLKGDYLNKKHLPELLKFTENKTAVVIGNGLCREEETLETIIEYLKNVNIPCVIDADAIHAVAQNKKVIENKNFIITPHGREFEVLSGVKVSTNLNERIEAVKKVASELKTTILLKGHVDIISDGKEVALNKTGSPKLSVGGTGDTLTGVCGAMLSRGINTFIASCASAYVNGKAGEYAVKKYGESTIATDLIEKIHIVLGSVIEY
ncbi:NAD(P)H-hydrate dehydratase [archaeon]|nr:NAD(P)H-hydrate dehydratase [archaeon]